jgi:NADPH2 dehydrogenase
VRELSKFKLAYLHVIEARVSGNSDVPSKESVEFLVEAWNNTSPVLLAGGFNLPDARRTVDEKYRDRNVVIVFGRAFIANPDLPFRIKHGLELTRHRRDQFYTVERPEGYTDYPFSEAYVSQIDSRRS